MFSDSMDTFKMRHHVLPQMVSFLEFIRSIIHNSVIDIVHHFPFFSNVQVADITSRILNPIIVWDNVLATCKPIPGSSGTWQDLEFAPSNARNPPLFTMQSSSPFHNPRNLCAVGAVGFLIYHTRPCGGWASNR